MDYLFHVECCNKYMLTMLFFSFLFSPASLKRGDMSEKKNPSVFLDASIDGDPVERIVIEVIKYLKSLVCMMFYPSFIY